MSALVCVARIGAAHGVRGAVKLWTFTEDPFAVTGYGPLSTRDGARSLEVAHAREAKGFLVATFKGVTTRNEAERRLWVQFRRAGQTYLVLMTVCCAALMVVLLVGYERGGAGRALHRIVEMHHHLAAGAVQPPQRKVDSADHHGQHVVEVVGDAAGQLADRLHLLDLAELGLGGLALGGLGLQRLVRLPQLLGALANRIFELFGALGLAFRLPACLRVLAQRLNRDHTEEDRAQADDDPEKA